MKLHTPPMAAAYLFAAILLSIYGTEVCPYIDGVGLLYTLPTFTAAFGLCFMIRRHIFGQKRHTPTTALKLELSLWVLAAGLVYLINSILYGFPLGSGLKVLTGHIALGLPVACFYGLRIEADEIHLAKLNQHRVHPSGPSRSIPTHLYRFVFGSQIFLGLVTLLLVVKDLDHLTQATAEDMEALVFNISIEVIGSFCILLAANLAVARQYAKNLKLLLTQQLKQMDRVAEGDLCALVFDPNTNQYAPHNREWVKDRVFNILKKQAH